MCVKQPRFSPADKEANGVYDSSCPQPSPSPSPMGADCISRPPDDFFQCARPALVPVLPVPLPFNKDNCPGAGCAPYAGLQLAPRPAASIQIHIGPPAPRVASTAGCEQKSQVGEYDGTCPDIYTSPCSTFPPASQTDW